MAELRYFADTLFFEMETQFSDFVKREEGRAVDEYNAPSKLSALPGRILSSAIFKTTPMDLSGPPLRITGKKMQRMKKR